MMLSSCHLFSQADHPQLDLDQKNPRDRREKRVVQLDNHLTALLISDPDLNKSAAAIDVAVGSLEDPEDHQGLAHFLEHMLFLGTKKYPEVDGYQKFLNTKQGYSNAYTAETHTNYFFEVNHDGFPEALDRFAQFFIAPIFDEKFVDRERNAVHSEHQKNLKDDMWRSHMVFERLHKKGHPKTKFATGDLKTLANASRDILMEFYQKYYSANRMKLALMSPLSLDDQEKSVRELFAHVPNFDRKALSYDPEFFDPKELPRWIRIQSIKELKELSLIFALPEQESDWQAKSARILSHILGYEGEGSLLKYLKDKNLVSSLSAGLEGETYGALLQIDMDLTDHGYDHQKSVIQAFFSYIDLLKKAPLPAYIYDERKIMADLQYIYREPKEGGQVVSQYASRMHVHDPMELDKRDQLHFRFDPKGIEKLLGYLTFDRMNVLTMSQGEPVAETEPYYGTGYSVEKIKESFVDGSGLPELTLPKPNPFIPKDLELLSSDKKTSPKKLSDTPWGSFWFQQDDSFFLPKTMVRLILLTDRVNSSPKEKVLSQLYQSAFLESYSTWNYDISLAGLNYILQRQDRGIQLDFFGYSSSVPELMEAVRDKLPKITIDEPTFQTIKTDFKRALANGDREAAYNQAFYELKYLTTQGAIHRHALTSQVDAITLDELKDYAQSLYTNLAYESFAYGSTEPEKILEAVGSYPKSLGKLPLPQHKRALPLVLAPELGRKWAFTQVTQTNNDAYLLQVPFGRRDFALNAALRIGVAHLESRFFTELRTNQQLGYVVKADLDLQEKLLGMFFLVQSDKKDPIYIEERVEEFLAMVLKELESLPQEEFETLRQAVVTDLLRTEKTIPERHGMIFSEIYVYGGFFDYKRKIAEKAQQLSKEEMVQTFRRALKPEGRSSLGVYLWKEGSLPTAFPKNKGLTPIKNKEAFKATMPVL
jgi:insulysin